MIQPILLITYPDSMGGSIAALTRILDSRLQGAVGQVHLLPFYPSSGDRGFAPLRYDRPDPAFGSWDDVEELAARYDLMCDFMINHISRQSPYCQDYLKNKDASPWRDLFIRWREFWPGGEPSPEQLAMIYKRKPRAPHVPVRFADGTTEELWCTFGEEQLDIDLKSAVGRRFVEENLSGLARHGAKTIRLDAFAFSTKRAGTNCFFVEPDIWEMFRWVEQILRPFGTRILPEIHRGPTVQKKLADHGYWTYDFCLPMLVLHAIYSASGAHLTDWLNNCPRCQYTTLDTHDGIGVVDVEELLTPEEIAFTKQCIFNCGAGVKPEYNTPDYNNLDIYQVNTTYYSALGERDDAYLLARAIQFFAPGVPQVYYVGLLAGRNDIEQLERTREGRSINRHDYTAAEIDEALERPVVQRLVQMMRWRGECPAFDERAACKAVLLQPHLLEVRREYNGYEARLHADLAAVDFCVEVREQGGPWRQVRL